MHPEISYLVNGALPTLQNWGGGELTY